VIPSIADASGKHADQDFAVCSKPEFTHKGCAVADFFNPRITVLGLIILRTSHYYAEIYDGFPGRVFETSLAGAEMVKYMCPPFKVRR